MDISVVIPLYNEEESLPELYSWIERVMNANDFTFEVIFINDGSTDATEQIALSYGEKLRARGIDFIYICQENRGAGSRDQSGTKNIFGRLFNLA